MAKIQYGVKPDIFKITPFLCCLRYDLGNPHLGADRPQLQLANPGVGTPSTLAFLRRSMG